MVRPCGARGFVDPADAVLHQCIRLLIGGCCAPSHHGYQRACDLISGQASNEPLGSPVFACAGKTDPPSLLIALADLGGLRMLATSSFAPLLRAVPLFAPDGCSFVPACGCADAPGAGAVKAGRRAGLAAYSGVARP